MAPITNAGQKRKRLEQQLPKKAQRPRKIKRASSYHSSSSEDEAEPIRNDEIQDDIAATLPATTGLSDDEGVELPNLETSVTGTVDQKGQIVPSNERDKNKGLALNAPPRRKTTSLADQISGLVNPNANHSEAPASASSDEEEVEAASEDNASDSDTSVDSDDISTTASSNTRALRKRNDPSAFASSISKILSSKLTASQRSDPILSRSRAATSNLRDQADERLTQKAKRQIREDRRTAKEKGREKDVLGLEREDVQTGLVVERERELRRTAQKGVVKLFNAVRASQMAGLAEAKGQEKGGEAIGSIDRRKEKVGDLGKKAFLELLSGGGGGGV